MLAEASLRPTPRADLVSGAVWIVIGIAITIGSWRMDRLESQGVPWFTAPGLVPGIMGAMIVLAALGITLRALARMRRSASDGVAAAAPETPFTRRAAITIALCLAFAAGAVGRVPFPIAAATYLFLHIAILQYPERRANGEVARGLLVAAVIAVAVASAVSYIFQEIFLVRLP